MDYTEIEEVFRAAHMPRTVEQLRSAVGIEAAELIAGIKGDLDEQTAIEQARDFYAEDISRWVGTQGNLEADMLLSQRSRYTQSWAFAQIIIARQESEIEDIAIPEVDPDTLTRICIANAELGSLVAELVGKVTAGPEIDFPHPSRQVFSDLAKVLDHAKAPDITTSGRHLSCVERLEALLEIHEEALSFEPKPIPNYANPNELLQKAGENIIWLVQNIHQSHHQENSGLWQNCLQGTCGSAGHILAQIGYDKSLCAIPVAV